MNNTLVSINDIQVFCSPDQYKQQLLLLIANARTRIYITALYLQDDDAGKEILHALYQAKTNYPALDVKVFVDFHRAQRGLIGEKNSLGNRALYLALESQYDVSIDIYGVAVKSKEVFGVLHLKGMFFDDQVFYTGASINDIYFNQHGRYRLDRYYLIKSATLADTLCKYLTSNFLETNLAPRLNGGELPDKAQQKSIIQQLKVLVKKANYSFSRRNLLADKKTTLQGNITITPLVGCGARGNQLNKAIRKVVQKTQTELLILTPYFNLPKSLAKDVNKALKRGVKVTLIIGDKTANDFYIPPEKPFTTIGIVPYLYEVLLVRYVKKQKRNIDKGLLNIRLWKDSDNSFHLKGLVSDSRYHFITGSNLNPRAWALDLENGLLLDDEQGQLMPAFEQEWAELLKNTQLISHFNEIDQIKDYPEKPRNLLKKLRIVQIDRLLKRFL
ncbi:MAG: CDP-diacylglycerol--serine O-phosphatidyltransferase [Colwellia sp.]|nr:CDP-diacylglycerol--serine O-phosphatidyltransferase [Colwellia sp.]